MIAGSLNPIMLGQIAAGGTSINVALQANGGVASASSTVNGFFNSGIANDGFKDWSRNPNASFAPFWNDGTSGTWPDWLQITFNASYSINRIDVYTTADNNTVHTITNTETCTASGGIRNFKVQYWNGSAWVDLADVTDNTLTWRRFDFSPVTTDRIRVLVSSGWGSNDYSRIMEVEAYTA